MSRSNNHRTALVDSKRHYKMYKSKKGWIVAGITTATMAGMFLTTTFTANADSIDPTTSSTTLTTPEATPNADVSDVTNKTGSTENGDGYNVSVDHTALDNAVSNAKTAGVDVTQGETTSTTVSSKDASSAVSSISSDYAQQTSEVETATKKQEAKNSAYSNDTQDAEQTNAANKEKIDNAVQALKDAGGSAIYDNSKDTTTTATIDNYSETKKQVNDSVESTVKNLEDATAQKQAENKVANVAQDRSELDSAVEKAKSILGEKNVHQTESVQTDKVTAANADQISNKIKQDYTQQVDKITQIANGYLKDKENYDKSFEEYKNNLSSQGINVINDLRLAFEGSANADYEVLQQPVYIEGNHYLGAIVPSDAGTINVYYNGNVNGDFLKVTYTNLNNSYYKNKKISKIVATYSNLIADPSHLMSDARYDAVSNNNFPQNRRGYTTASIYKNIYLGAWIGNAKSMDVHFRYYDSDGNEISVGDNAYLFVGSLNHYSWGNGYTEKQQLLTQGNVTIPNGSAVTNHDGNVVYADNAIDGNGNNEWEKTNPILGTALFHVTGNEIGVRYIIDNSSPVGSGSWFYSRTSLNDVDKPIEPEKPSVDYHYNEPSPASTDNPVPMYNYNNLNVEKPAPEKVNYHYSELNVLHDDATKTDWNVVDNKDNNIANKPVAAGDIFTYDVKPGDLKASVDGAKATREEVKSYTVVDTLPKGVRLNSWSVSDGEAGADITKNWNVSFNEQTNQITLTAKEELVKIISADLSKTYKSPTFHFNVTAVESGAKIENTAKTYINGIESKTNTVTNTITKSEPEKKVEVSGNNADGTKTIANDVQDYSVTLDYTKFADVSLSDAIINNEFSFTDKMTITNGVATLNEDSLALVTEDKAAIDPSLYTKEVTKTDTGYTIKITWNDSRKALQVISGKKLNLNYSLKVNDGVSGQVTNEISQNNFGVVYEGNTTNVTVVDINPTKDVVDAIGSSNSLNGKTVPLNSVIYYKVTSSELPENRSTVAKEWVLSDPLDKKVSFNGEKEILAGSDIYDASGNKIISKGDYITKYFTINLRTEDGNAIISATPNKEYLDLLNLDKNRKSAQKYDLYIGAKVIDAGWAYNTADETLNGDPDKTNTVKTFTFNPVTPTPEKDVAVGNTTSISPESIDGRLVAPGDTLTYILKGQTLDKYHETIVSYSAFDIFDQGVTYQGFKAFLNTADGKQVDVTDLLVEQKNGNTINWVASNELIKLMNSDEYNTQSGVAPTIYATATVNKDHAEKIDNVYYVVINDKQGQSNVVKNTSTKPTPVKEDFDTEGNNIDGKNVLPASTNRYSLLWNLSKYKGVKASKDAIQKGFYFVDDINDEAFKDIDLSKASFKTSDSKDVLGIKVSRYTSVSEAPKEVQDMLAKNNLEPQGSFIIYSAEDPQKFFEDYVETGTDIKLTFDATLNENFSGEYTNKAYEVDFGQAYETNEVTNKVIKSTPSKTTLNELGEDINDKNVARGDKLQYSIVWDLSDFTNFNVTKDQLAKGLSVYDDYDEGKLRITDANKQAFIIRDANNNVIPSNQYTLTWDTQKGAWTVSANDPLAFLETYGGQKLKISFFATVDTEAVGDIYNVAVQNNFGQEIETNQVVNHIPKMEPKKDVNISVDDSTSLDGSEIAVGTVFNYVLDSSTRPANYGGITDEWSYTDILDLDHDEYTGQYVVKAKYDFTLSDGTVVKAGEDITKYFDATYDSNTGTFKVSAKKEYLDIINSDINKLTEQGWKAYIQVKRIASGDVNNTAQESYNNEIINTNTVTTHTPEPEQPKPEQPTKNVPTPDVPDPTTETPVKSTITPTPTSVSNSVVEKQAPKEALPQMGDSSTDDALAALGVVLGAIGTISYAGSRKKRKGEVASRVNNVG